MKLKITSVFLVLTGVCFGAAITISSVGNNYNGTDDYGILLSNDNPVGAGAGLARVGFFTTLSDAQVLTLATAQDYATLFGVGSFQTIVSDDFTGIVGAYGANAGFVNAGIIAYSAVGLNNTLYAYITSGTELGLFKSSLTIVPDPITPPETTYDVRFSSGTPIIGNYGPTYQVAYTGIGAGPMTVNSFQLVPEPSAMLLGALGILGLLRRRRN